MKGILPESNHFWICELPKRPPWSYRANGKKAGAAILTSPNVNWVLASPKVSTVLLKYSAVFYTQSTLWLKQASVFFRRGSQAHKIVIQDSVLRGLLFSDSMIVCVIGPEMAGYWSQMAVCPWPETRLERMDCVAFYQARGKEASLYEVPTLSMYFPHILYLT